MDALILLFGVASVAFLIIKENKCPRIEDSGSFNIISEPNSDYEEYEITKGKKLKYLFSPTVIVFTVLAVASMAVTLIAILLGGSWGI